MSVLLVLGAGGFIGRRVTEAARAMPDVRVLGGGRGPRPSSFDGGFAEDWLAVDVVHEPLGLASHLRAERPAVVVNCIGATTGSMSALVEANLVATARLLESLETSGVDARLVHIGSAAEYGPGVVGTPVTESACPKPFGPYGISKLGGSQLVIAAAAADRVQAVVLRVFNVLGPRMPEDTLAGSVMRRVLDAEASGAAEIEMGPLDHVRDFTDIRDVARAILAAASVARLEADVINVGSGVGRPARDLVEAIARGLGFRGAIAEIAIGSPRSADVPWQVADRSLAGRVLAWEPVQDFESTVESIVGAGLDA